MAAVFVGIAVAKYKASRHPHAQGFVEVDQVKKKNNHTRCINNNNNLVFCLLTFVDDRRSSYTRRTTCGQHANQWLRKSNVQILRSEGINEFIKLFIIFRYFCFLTILIISMVKYAGVLFFCSLTQIHTSTRNRTHLIFILSLSYNNTQITYIPYEH